MSETDGTQMTALDAIYDGQTSSSRLINKDLAPLRPMAPGVPREQAQTWNWYNIFAFWMADIHSVGGYVFAASLFALGLSGWQVLVCLLVGICIVQLFANLLGRMGQMAGVPYAVVTRVSFGVFGANIPAVIRGLIAVVWYGIQTYLASGALTIVFLKFFPAMAALTKVSWLGLSEIGWISFLVIWVAQAVVFWHGMEAIKKFIDWAGPAVYAAMILLAIWIVYHAGVKNISFSLSDKHLQGWNIIWQMILATALVTSYFAGPTLNFSDFSRYCKTFKDVKRGNFWGLPVNFLFFSIITVIVVSGTVPLYGHMITNPVETVSKINDVTAALLGALTFVVATVGINIVANFVSPAFDFSNVWPSKISFRTGGMIAAVGSIFLTPWNLFDNPGVIHYTVDLLAAAIGPIYGIILTDFYLIKSGKISVTDLFTEKHQGTYWFREGVNYRAVGALIPSTVLSIGINFIPGDLATFSLFIGGIVGAVLYLLLSRIFK